MSEINGNGNGNGKNGVFLKVVIGALIAGLVASGGGMVKLYRDVGVLQSDSQTMRRLDKLEALAADIASDRDKRTIILQGFRDDVADLKRRLDFVERRR